MISTPPRRLAFASVLAAAGLGFLASSAAAAPVEVELRQTGQAQIVDSGKIKVAVDPKKAGKATLVVSSAGEEGRVVVTKRTTAKVGKSGKVLAAPLTNRGAKRVGSCVAQKLKAKVKFVPKRGKKATARDNQQLNRNLALCSVGSEDPEERPYFGPPIDTPSAAACDFLDTSVCLHPWPNDYFTTGDGTTETGRRVSLTQGATPENVYGARINPTDFNRADGFSPGQAITVKVAGLDNQAAFDQSALVPITDLAAYDDPSQAVVVINAETGERHPIWAELDQLADADEDRVLMIRPAVNFEEGERYIVALRHLADAEGGTIEPPLAFRAYRDRLITEQQVIEDRRPAVEAMLGDLQDAGVERADLHLAWDFTVASADSIAGRVLAMRDDAFDRLGDEDLSDLTVEGVAPDFDVDEVTNYELCSAGDPGVCEPGEDDLKLRQVKGTVDVPCYLNQDGCPPGATFAYDNAADRTPNFTEEFEMAADFTCIIPRAVSDGAEITPARPSLYGHGLLGTRAEVESGSGGNIRAMANEHNFAFCATDWVGMSTPDVNDVVLPILNNVGNFPRLADRSQQGFVNFMYLGRAMIHPNGFNSHEAFNIDPDGEGSAEPAPVIDTTRLFFDGNSQGGIMGGALTALSPDFERSALGVPGMNYSTLLQRSVDFDEYAEGIFPGVGDTPLGLYDSYPSKLERPLLLSMMQMLWDRAEANGYAQHMTDDPLPNTPAHQTLLHPAFGDHQVANVAAEVEARTIGASILTPALDPGRHWSDDPFMGIPAIGSFPYTGSAIVYWDGGPLEFDGTFADVGTPTPPNGNVPPRPGEGFGADPHSWPRRTAEARQQKSDFLQVGGAIMNGCAGAAPCYTNGWTGP